MYSLDSASSYTFILHNSATGQKESKPIHANSFYQPRMKIFAALVLALSAFASTSEAFTATANNRVSALSMPIVGYSTSSRSGSGAGFSTELRERRPDVSSEERGIDKMNDIQGITAGLYLGAIVLALNVWIFSIPVEFRRTRICNEADTRDYPTRCMTREMWTTGIQEYYANGKKRLIDSTWGKQQ